MKGKKKRGKESRVGGTKKTKVNTLDVENKEKGGKRSVLMKGGGGGRKK